MHYYFDWDIVKAASNFRKHGVSFEEAIGVFKDPEALSLFDREQSDDEEERWITVGRAGKPGLLLVIHTVQESVNRYHIRIISARRATKLESMKFEEGAQ